MVEQISITGGSDISRLQQMYSSNKPIFMLIRKDGCPPCEQTKPEWMKIPHNEDVKPLDIVVADIEEQALSSLGFMKPPVNIVGFPTMVHIKHKQIHPFEEGRTVDAFANWIKSTFEKSGAKSRTKSTFEKSGAKTRTKSTFEKSGAKSRAKSRAKSTFKKGGAKKKSRSKKRRRGKR
jgi:hypothetical protein